MNTGSNEPEDVRTSALVQALILQREHGRTGQDHRSTMSCEIRPRGSRFSGLGLFPQVRAASPMGHLCE